MGERMERKGLFIVVLIGLILIGGVFSGCIEQIDKGRKKENVPTIVSTVPIKYACDVSPTTTIKIVFSKPMYESSTAHKALSFTPTISTDNLQSNWIDNKTLEISNLSFEYGKKYIVAITHPHLGELKDLEGKYLKSGYSWYFTITSVPIVDLLDAINENMIEASFIGWKRNSVIINLTSHADYKMEVKVPRGLILNSLDDSKSDMATEEVRGVITTSPLPPPSGFISIYYSPTSGIILDKNKTKYYFINAYSIEFNKTTVGYDAKEGFSIGDINFDIQKILETTDGFHYWDKSIDAIQSAIWCFTDDVSKEELLDKREDVSDKEILDAKTMLVLAGFETSSKKLFSEEIIIPTAKMKERLENNDVVIYVNKVREDNKIRWSKAEKGCRWVILDVIIKNKRDGPIDVDVYDIKLRNRDTRIEVYDYSYKTRDLDYPFKDISSPPIPPKDTYRGEIAFEVPNNISNLNMIFDIEGFYGEIMLADSLNPESIPFSEFTPSYKIGEKAVDKNIAITVNSKREAKIIKDRGTKENWTYLILNITIENIGSENLSYYLYPFAIQDKNGYLFESHYTTADLENAFESGELPPGESYQGEISFEIPKSSENLEMWYSAYGGPYIYIDLSE